jgi:hypothetical protein
MRRAVGLHPGEAKIDRCDTYVLADTGRTKRNGWLAAPGHLGARIIL